MNWSYFATAWNQVALGATNKHKLFLVAGLFTLGQPCELLLYNVVASVCLRLYLDCLYTAVMLDKVL